MKGGKLCHGHNRTCVFLHVRVRSLRRAVGQLLRFLRFDMDVTLFYFHVLSNTNAELFDMSHKFLRPPACSCVPEKTCTSVRPTQEFSAIRRRPHVEKCTTGCYHGITYNYLTFQRNFFVIRTMPNLAAIARWTCNSVHLLSMDARVICVH